VAPDVPKAVRKVVVLDAKAAPKPVLRDVVPVVTVVRRRVVLKGDQRVIVPKDVPVVLMPVVLAAKAVRKPGPRDSLLDVPSLVRHMDSIAVTLDSGRRLMVPLAMGDDRCMVRRVVRTDVDVRSLARLPKAPVVGIARRLGLKLAPEVTVDPILARTLTPPHLVAAIIMVRSTV
jgi:hypothetical protein